MWIMFEDSMECSECGGAPRPPPQFLIPPPPRPPSMADFQAPLHCTGQEMDLQAPLTWGSDMCAAMPVFEANPYGNRSLQTSAMIAVFSLLLILVVLISSLFVWKNKRKVQNLLPCKAHSRGPQMVGALSVLNVGHATYEDPDTHLGHHRPLVIRHHHNIQMLHAKSIHYPSGYPMTRSPPFLVTNSPGPDPYRSNDNLYEELGQLQDSDAESESQLHSDDNFAEDELSLQGERSFNKTLDADAASTIVPTYVESQIAAASTANCGAEVCLSSLSPPNDAPAETASSPSSSTDNNNPKSNPNCTQALRNGANSLITGIIRTSTGRRTHCAPRHKGGHNLFVIEPQNTYSYATEDISNLASLQQLPVNSSSRQELTHQHPLGQPPRNYYHSLQHAMPPSRNEKAAELPASRYHHTIESGVERRNRLNVQRTADPTSSMSMVYQQRVPLPGNSQIPTNFNNTDVPYCGVRENFRGRRHRVAPPRVNLETAYGYSEPVCHRDYNCLSYGAPSSGLPYALTAFTPCVMPEDIAGGLSSTYRQRNPASYMYPNSSTVYGYGDSSFGSDSGYSHHTPSSSIGRHDYDCIPPATSSTHCAETQKTRSKLASALSLPWPKRTLNNLAKPTRSPDSTHPATGASGPSNNSATAMETSTLSNISVSYSAAASSQQPRP